jgi:hypothetical protein
MLFKMRRAIPTLMEMLSDPAVRVSCAAALYLLGPDQRVREFFLQVGDRELSREAPDRKWLRAVIHGLGCPNDSQGAELLVTIFERTALPGWLRGDAADKLGCSETLLDRRTKLHHRAKAAALRGLFEESIEVQFGSMYLLGCLCAHRRSPGPLNDKDARSACRRLREIAAHDHRLAPGFWWPMSAQAQDVLACITTGQWPEPEASQRWIGASARGDWRRT